MKIYKLFLIAGVASLTFGCDSFLDKLPDNRAAIYNEETLAELITSAYPATFYHGAAEFSSDNVTDNGDTYNYFMLYNQEYYRWQDVTSISQDTPYALWSDCYQAISSANHALDFIKQKGDPDDLRSYKAEALLCRAYAHFILVNVFCQHYSETYAATDLGIPYIEEAEKKVYVLYSRGTVKEVYEKINTDIENALPYVDDNNYSQPKYHFNRRAAHAFAARFNLYWRKDLTKVVKYATIAFNDKKDLRDYPYNATMNATDGGTYYLDPTRKANLMLGASRSWFCNSATRSNRYGHSTALAQAETVWSPGIWTSSTGDAYNTGRAIWPLYGYANTARPMKVRYYWLYTDIVSGVGYGQDVYPLFTTDEALLLRAEANLFLGEEALALNDLSMWLDSHNGQSNGLTMAKIQSLFPANETYTTTKKKVNPDFDVPTTDTGKSLMYAIIHTRRAETIMEGLRWFDIKRYGIEITHVRNDYAQEKFETLKIRDLRSAIQLPSSVIGAGMEANPR